MIDFDMRTTCIGSTPINFEMIARNRRLIELWSQYNVGSTIQHRLSCVEIGVASWQLIRGDIVRCAEFVRKRSEGG